MSSIKQGNSVDIRHIQETDTSCIGGVLSSFLAYDGIVAFCLVSTLDI